MDRNAKTYNAHIENLRCIEYPSLLSTTYLDHAGTTLYSKSLIDAFHQDLTSNLYGNPHSACPASHLSTERVEDARLRVLEFFNADAEHFDVVFTANATASIKLVADCFRDQNFWYGFHRDAHSSIVGVREVATAGSRCFVSDEDVEDWIESLKKAVERSSPQLFAYPAQSNMTGHRTPLSWPAKIRKACRNDRNTPYILLDAASYLTSGRLDLSNNDAAPDFVALSFYKIFGFPDLGALLIKKTAFDVMTGRRYFGGGTVDQVTVIDRAYSAIKRTTMHDFLEDGTLPFHNIVALEHAIAVHERNFGSAAAVSKHTAALASQLYTYMQSCCHANGKPAIEVHKDSNSVYGDPTTQGPIIAFSMRQSDGAYVAKSHFEKLAIECGFQIRTGGVCNPGGIATCLELNHWELRRNFTEGVRCGDDVDIVGGKPTGIIRVSLGPMSTMSDILRFQKFLGYFFVDKAVSKVSSISHGTRNDQNLTSSITPLRGCDRIAVPDVPSASIEVWDQEWSIADLETGQIIESASQFGQLKVELDLEAEELVLRHSSRADALRISLWTVPPEREKAHRMNGRIFDIYQEPHIPEWLGQVFEHPCTLARYRKEDIGKAPYTTTCIVVSCKRQCQSTETLWTHYHSHAKEFLHHYPFSSQSPPARTNGWRSLLKRNSKSLRTHSADKVPHVTVNILPTSEKAESSLPKNYNMLYNSDLATEENSHIVVSAIDLRS